MMPMSYCNRDTACNAEIESMTSLSKSVCAFYENYFLGQGVPEQQTRDIIKVAEQKGVGKLDMFEII